MKSLVKPDPEKKRSVVEKEWSGKWNVCEACGRDGANWICVDGKIRCSDCYEKTKI